MAPKCISFAAGLPNNELVVERFTSQAVSTGFFSSVNVVSGSNHPIYIELMRHHGDFIANNRRGFGYWLWKPFILREYVRTISDGEVIFYCDIGCEFSPCGSVQFNNFLHKLSNRPIIAFQAGSKLFEFQWTKSELIDYAGLSSHDRKSPQIAATFFFFVVNDFTRRFLDEWYKISTIFNYKLINDDIGPQCHGFVEHRHDQSIFSVLLKKYAVIPFIYESNFPKQLYFKKSFVYSFPVHAIRNLTPYAVLNLHDYSHCNFGRISKFKFRLYFYFIKLWRRLCRLIQ